MGRKHGLLVPLKSYSNRERIEAEWQGNVGPSALSLPTWEPVGWTEDFNVSPAHISGIGLLN